MDESMKNMDHSLATTTNIGIKENGRCFETTAVSYKTVS